MAGIDYRLVMQQLNSDPEQDCPYTGSPVLSFGCSENGAIILSDFDKQQMVVIMQVAKDDLWLRFYTELSGVSGTWPEAVYGSYEIGPLEDIVKSVRSAFEDMNVVQGKESAILAGLADEYCRVIPLTEEDEAAHVLSPEKS